VAYFTLLYNISVMKLRCDMDNQLYVESRLGDIGLIELLKIALKRDGRTLHRLERDSGLSHNRLTCLNYPSAKKRNQKPGSTSLLIALMELGYEIRIEKKAD
jgi:hypothetical protein